MKKFVALLVCIIMLTQGAFAMTFVDMPDNWATGALERAVENGLLSGSDNHIYPNNNLTRAQMATIVVRAFGAEKDADISAFVDVKPEDWFYSSMSKAVAMGAFTGSGDKLNPNSPITRQEAFVVLARVFSINLNPNIDLTLLDEFADAADVSDWAKEPLAAIIESGYVGGSNGLIKPKAYITRSEFAAVMDRLVNHYVDDAEAAFPEEGNVMVRAKGVTLTGLTGDRMIVIGDSVNDEVLDFTGANLSGLLLVRSGKDIKIDGVYGRVRSFVPESTIYLSATSQLRGVYTDGAVDLGTLTPTDSSNN